MSRKRFTAEQIITKLRETEVELAKRLPTDDRRSLDGTPHHSGTAIVRHSAAVTTSAMCWLRGRIRSRARADVRPGIPSLGRRDRGQDPDSSAPIRCPRDSQESL